MRTLSALGYLTSSFAAYIAGELVYNLGMGISRNSWVAGPDKFTDVGDAHDLDDGQMHKYDLEGSPVVLIRHEDAVHAFGGTFGQLAYLENSNERNLPLYQRQGFEVVRLWQAPGGGPRLWFMPRAPRAAGGAATAGA